MAYEDGEPPPLAILSAARRVGARVPSEYGEGRTGASTGRTTLRPVSGPGGDGRGRRAATWFLALTAAAIAAFDTWPTQRPGERHREESGSLAGLGRVDAGSCEGLSNLMLGYGRWTGLRAPCLARSSVRHLEPAYRANTDSGRYRTTWTAHRAGRGPGRCDLRSTSILRGREALSGHRRQSRPAVRRSRADGDHLGIRAFHAAYSGDAQAGVMFPQGALD